MVSSNDSDERSRGISNSFSDRRGQRLKSSRKNVSKKNKIKGDAANVDTKQKRNYKKRQGIELNEV